MTSNVEILALVVVVVYMPIFFDKTVAAQCTDSHKALHVHHDVEIRKHHAFALEALPVLRLADLTAVGLGVFAQPLAAAAIRKDAVGSKTRECSREKKDDNKKA